MFLLRHASLFLNPVVTGYGWLNRGERDCTFPCSRVVELAERVQREWCWSRCSCVEVVISRVKSISVEVGAGGREGGRLLLLMLG